MTANRRLVISEEAILDVYYAVEHIAKDDPSAADRVYSSLLKGFHRLRDFPKMGNTDFAGLRLREGYLSFFIAGHLVLYGIAKHEVRIVRVIHPARDPHYLINDFIE